VGCAHATVLLVGFQAAGTLGRLLQDGADRVRIQGETIRVARQHREIEGYSGHADGRSSAAGCGARPGRGRHLPGAWRGAGDGGARRACSWRTSLAEEGGAAPVLDEAYAPGTRPAAAPAGGDAPPADPAEAGRPDWHNARAALLLAIEEAIERAPDEGARRRIMGRLRGALDHG
jgi:metallo-beta-lactamase family protein